MVPGEVKAIRTTDPIVILRAKGRSLRNLLIIAAAYDNVQQRTILSIKEIKAAETEMSKRRMARMQNMDGDEEGSIIIPDSSDGIYVTASMEAQCRLITKN